MTDTRSEQLCACGGDTLKGCAERQSSFCPSPTSDGMPTETATLRSLANAVDALENAKRDTKRGFIHDHCENALHEIRRAMRLAIGGSE